MEKRYPVILCKASMKHDEHTSVTTSTLSDLSSIYLYG